MQSPRLPGDEGSLSVRVNNELEVIIEHLGPDAPDPFAEIEPEVNRDGLIQFVTPVDVYSLAGDFAVRFRLLPDNTEDVSFWRDGLQIRHHVGPPQGHTSPLNYYERERAKSLMWRGCRDISNL
jgi:hypothetical protein